MLQSIKTADPKQFAHIISLLDTFEQDGYFCMVLEYCFSFNSFIQSMGSKPLDSMELRFISIQLLTCLAFLKNIDMIHADFKIENILIRNDKFIDKNTTLGKCFLIYSRVII